MTDRSLPGLAARVPAPRAPSARVPSAGRAPAGRSSPSRRWARRRWPAAPRGTRSAGHGASVVLVANPGPLRFLPMCPLFWWLMASSSRVWRLFGWPFFYQVARSSGESCNPFSLGMVWGGFPCDFFIVFRLLRNPYRLQRYFHVFLIVSMFASGCISFVFRGP